MSEYILIKGWHGSKPLCGELFGSALKVPNQNGAPVVNGVGNVSYCVNNGRISDSPDFRFNANTEIRFPTGNITPFVSALVSYRPSFFSQNVQFRYPSRTLLNAFVGVRGPDEKWSVSAFARNLLDQNKVTNISLGTYQINPILAGWVAALTIRDTASPTR